MSDAVTPAGELSGQIVRLVRQVAALRAHATARQRHGVEWSSYVLLLHLVKHGPMRSSALAEVVCADPSTVSRQAASLVDLGMVERRPDPADGRAAQLVATDKGRALFEQMRSERDALFGEVLRDWRDDEVIALATMLDRFTNDLERYRPGLPQALDAQEN